MTARGGSDAAGIGNGKFSGDCTFSTGANGNAFIIASSISDETGKETSWSGVIFEGNDGKVYGSPELKEDATIPNGKTLTIENGKTLTIGDKATLTNNGTIQINQGGTLENNGTLTGSGTFTGDGDITGTKLTQAAPAANEGYTIDYAAETITVNGDYKVNTEQSFTGTDITTGTSLTNYMDRKLYIRKPENNFYAASGAAEIQISRPAAPAFSINTEAEGVAISSDYYYNTTGADYTSNIWTQGDGSLVSVQPGNSIYIYKTATASEFKSAVQTLPAPSRGVTPSVSIDYENETLNTTAAMQYASGHSVQSWESCSEDMAVNAFGWDGSEVTAQFRTAATADKYASEAQEVTIPARPATPSGLQGQNTSFAGESDGTITGLTPSTAYQISKDSGSWEDKTTTGEGTITGLAAGDYQVRLKATATAFASAAANVTVGSGDERTYALTVENVTFDDAAYGDAQPAAKNITISSSGNSDATISSVTVSDTSSFTIGGSGSTVMAGGSIDTWTVQPNDGLSAGEHTATITVTYNNNATAEATVRFHVTGAAQAAPANAPELDSKSYNSVRLKTVSANANGAAAQYSKGNGQTWQDSPVFTGLSPSTKYTFVVRYEATGNYEASPASPVLEVTTEAAPVATYLVTVNGGTGGGSYAAGATVTITATVPNGQRFTGWTVNPASVTLANASSATTTFTMPAGNVTVTANFQSNSGGGNYDGGGTYTPPTTPTYPPTVERPSGGGGTPSTSPSNPKQGDTVTVTPKPDSGYEVDTITVIDRNGKPVEVTKKLDDTYTFTQPTGKVKIEVTYKPTQPIDRPWNNPFSDVSEGDWYYEAVRFVCENELMNGYADGRFAPGAPLSRAQTAQMLKNYMGN